MKQGISVLSLFDGMSCGQIALERAGIKVENYFASEIDKYAIQVTQANYPNTIQLGDVTQVKLEDLPKIDLLIGGSPCQGFSASGKGLNFEDSRSKLFFEFVRILKECNPKYFLLENVSMKQEWQEIISEYLGVNPIRINSDLVSAQKRNRLYWTNIPNINIPSDLEIYLKDIVEEFVDDKYFLSEKMLNYFKNRASNFNSGKVNIRSLESKATTLTSSSGSVDISDNFIVAMRGRRIDIDGEQKWIQQLEINESGKSNCLTSVQKDNILLNRGELRKLTPVEYERLQTVPDDYTSCVSNSQRYKMLGNGWTVDVIAHIFKNISL